MGIIAPTRSGVILSSRGSSSSLPRGNGREPTRKKREDPGIENQRVVGERKLETLLFGEKKEKVTPILGPSPLFWILNDLGVTPGPCYICETKLTVLLRWSLRNSVYSFGPEVLRSTERVLLCKSSTVPTLNLGLGVGKEGVTDNRGSPSSLGPYF